MREREPITATQAADHRTITTHDIRDAIDQVRMDSYIHSVNHQYQLCTYDPAVRAWREGISKPYAQALSDLTEWRAYRALEILLDGDEPQERHCPAIHDRGTLRERVVRALAQMRVRKA